MLDTSTATWLEPKEKGQPPLPRASHAAAMLDDIWYIVGGGDNTRALCDMTTLQLPSDLSAPGAIVRWRGSGDAGEEEEGPRGEGLVRNLPPPLPRVKSRLSITTALLKRPIGRTRSFQLS